MADVKRPTVGAIHLGSDWGGSVSLECDAWVSVAAVAESLSSLADGDVYGDACRDN